MRQLRFRDGLAFIVLVPLLATVDATALHAQSKSKPATGKTRTYCIAADEVE
jgi:hypothetical protein